MKTTNRRALIAIPVCALLFAALAAMLASTQGRPSDSEAQSCDIIVCDGLQSGTARTKAPLQELDESEGTSKDSAPTDAPDASQAPIVAASSVELPREMKDHTLMVYMVGSDLEFDEGYASLDLQEMMRSGIDESRTNVVIFTGGSHCWHANVPNDQNCVIDIGSGTGRIVANTSELLNMGEPATLSAFVSWATENYPAKHAALVLWNHGAGPVGGYGFDQAYGYDCLSLKEMTEAMKSAGFGRNRMLDWVGFDACLMGSVEVAKTWQPYARYLVASEDVEDERGWDYSFLRTIGNAADARAVVASIVESFSDYHTWNDASPAQPGYTLSALDLNELGAIEAALDKLLESSPTMIASGTFARAHAHTRGFGSQANAKDADLVDLVDLADGMKTDYPKQVDALKDAMSQAVVANATNLDRAHGLSVVLPTSKDYDATEPLTKAYGKAVRAYAEQRDAGTGVDWGFPKVEQADDEYVVRLNDEQKKAFASAQYTLMFNAEGSGYEPILANAQIEPDEKGVLRIPRDPGLIVTADTLSPVPVRQTDADSRRATYRLVGHLQAGYEFVDSIRAAKSAIVSLVARPDSNEVAIASVTPIGTEAVQEGRASVDVEDYKTFMCSLGGQQYPKRAADGSLLPIGQWETSKTSGYWLKHAIRDELTFVRTPASHVDKAMSMQIILTDVTGEEHASELIPLAGPTHRTAEVPTDEGTLFFELFDDHAEWTGFRTEGKNIDLQIPEQVEGLPVTAVAGGTLDHDWTVRSLTFPASMRSIGPYALHLGALEHLELNDGLESIGDGSLGNCSHLAELRLPQSLRSIGRTALAGVGAHTITLPASLEYLGEAALTECANLDAYEVDGPCKAVRIQDGVIFSADGTTLMAFPAGRNGDYVTPAGTRRIGYGAFASTALESVTIGEGVTDIDNCAFFWGILTDSSLTSVSLPSSLRRVGSYAFGSELRSDPFYASTRIPVLRLGNHVQEIGDYAFSGINVGRFEVDEENPTFASPGGLLANKAGDTILQAPTNMDGPIVVPEGVTCIRANSFDSCKKGIELVLPETLSRISANAFGYAMEDEEGKDGETKRTRVYDVSIHCAHESASEVFAQRHKIAYDNLTEPDLLAYELAEERQGDVRLTFRIYAGHAVLCGIDGGEAPTHTALVVPDLVQGTPVTAIELANTEAAVGTERPSYPGDGWDSVRLPASLSSISPESIPFLRANKGFVLDEGNTSFSARDGVLFSADGKTLVAFTRRPVKWGERTFTYNVPEGTTTIGSGAFCESTVQRVVLPPSVRTIEENAFKFCELQDIELNEGLRSIGRYGLWCTSLKHIALPSTIRVLEDSALALGGYEGFTLPDKLEQLGSNIPSFGTKTQAIGSDTLRIGPRLKRIGTNSLGGLDIQRFEVDERNEAFSVVEGLLTDKEGTVLIRCPSGIEGSLRIPDGIERLAGNSLFCSPGITDIYFPDSVTAIAYQQLSDVTFHCANGSAAELYAVAHGIASTDEGI